MRKNAICARYVHDDFTMTAVHDENTCTMRKRAEKKHVHDEKKTPSVHDENKNHYCMKRNEMNILELNANLK